MSGGDDLAVGLVTACTQGDVSGLQTILSAYPDLDINYTTEGGVTLLMHTIIGAGTEVNPGGHYLETCQLLVQYGIQLETADLSNGRTAAHWATYYHRDDILSELIIAGSDMTCPDLLGTSPFHLAIQEEAIQCLVQCLRFLPREILEIPDAQFRLPLHHAVAVGSMEACQLLLSAEANVNQAQEGTGHTPLHLSAQLGQGPITELLLRSGAQPDVMDASGLTPVHIAAICESVEGGLGAFVRVVGGGDVLGVRDERGMTPLMQASAYGSEHNVKFLLRKKVDVLTVDTVEGKNALHWAAGSATPTSHGCVQMLFKKHRALIESRDNYGRTPLHACAVSGGVEALQVLVEGGCDVTSVDDEQRTAVHWATVSGNYVVLPRLLEVGCPLDAPDMIGATPTHYAVQHTAEPYPDLMEPGEYEQAVEQSKNVQACLAVLLDQGAKVNLVDQQGMEPLHLAAQYPNNLSACSALLTTGSDPIARDNLGMTPFHLAALHGVPDSCQLLLEHTGGIHGNDVDGEGRSALHLAVLSGSVECLGRLLEYGLNTDQSDEEQRTPCHVAARLGSLEMVQLLHSYGADLTLTSALGAHPSHEAAAHGHHDVLEYLLSAGSPVNAPAGQSAATPLHYAMAGGHVTCVQVLMDHGADVNAIATSEEGEKATPLDYCPDGFQELVDYLTSLGGVSTVEEAKIEEKTVEVEEVVATSDQVAEPVEGVVKPEEGVVEPEKSSTEPEVGVAEISPEEGAESETREPDTISVHTRPHTPTRPPQEPGPSFEPPETPPTVAMVALSRPPTPKKANLLQRAMSVLRRERKKEDESILSSTVGLYAAHATILAAIVIGTPLGEKTVEIAHKVATDTAEELRQMAANYEDQTLPDLIWLREEVPRTPTPPPPPSPTPTPPPPTPPPVEIPEDPYERRLRKAKAQLDTRKSPGYLAVEELVKAQDTHMRLKRQFQNDKLREDLQAMRQEFRREEELARVSSEKVLQRLAERMRKADQLSKEMNTTIEKQLEEARTENDNLSTLMADMGVSPRPTVAQWIKQKDTQKKAALQSSLISWDRTKNERNTAILLQQALTSQRALRHAAWGARKEISERIRKLKQAYDPQSLHTLTHTPPTLHTLTSPPHSPETKQPLAGLSPRQPVVKHKNKVALRKHKSTPTSSNTSVRATPSGFYKMGDSPTKPTVTSPETEHVWAVGHDYVDGRPPPLPPSRAFQRATGPKTIHAERTLHFVSPEEYKTQKSEEKQLTQRSVGKGQRSRAKTSVTITAADFNTSRVKKRRSSFTGPHYHTHGSSVGSTSPRQPTDLPILPMTVLDPHTLAPVAT